MIALAVGAGVAAGCSRSAVLPPPASLSRAPSPRVEPPPSAEPQLSLSPSPQPPLDLVPDQASGQSWKPDAPAREWTSIVIHHTATDRGDVDSIHEAHLDRKWLGIGYHFVIGNGNGMPDGEIEPTFRWREQLHGAHAGDEAYNQHGIGVCLVGNFEEHPPSDAQLAAVKRLVASLKRDYGIPAENVIGHSDVKATACPGKHFPMAEISHSGRETFLGRHVRGDRGGALAWRLGSGSR